jgi:hypothetical protein
MAWCLVKYRDNFTFTLLCFTTGALEGVEIINTRKDKKGSVKEGNEGSVKERGAWLRTGIVSSLLPSHVSLYPRVVTGEKNSPTVAHTCRKRPLK